MKRLICLTIAVLALPVSVRSQEWKDAPEWGTIPGSEVAVVLGVTPPTRDVEGEAGGPVAASDGVTLPVVYRFSGVTDDGEQGSTNRKEATSVTCTNLGSADATIAVEVYQWNGTDVYTGEVVAPPGRTFTFSTQNTTIYFDDILLGGSPGTPAIFQGSGVVRSSQPQAVVCTAQILDPLGYPPVYMTELEMVRTGALPTRYVFSGATDDGEQGSTNRKEATSVTCTNIGDQDTVIEVEVVQWNGTDSFSASVTAPPNRTFTFSTQNTTIFFDDLLLGGSPGTPAIFQGHGVITSNHDSVLCTAMVLDPLNYPPVYVNRIHLEPDFSHIFSNGFETGSATAWSVSVP